MIEIDKSKCDKCGICYENCPCDVFVLDADGSIIEKYSDECWHCCVCEMECPKGAILLHLHPMII